MELSAYGIKSSGFNQTHDSLISILCGVASERYFFYKTPCDQHNGELLGALSDSRWNVWAIRILKDG